MIDISTSKLEKAKNRDGDAGSSRPEWAEEAIALEEELGYGNGLPLAGVDYEKYPAPRELVEPQHGDFLRRLCDHELVNSVEDIDSELGGSGRTEQIQRALDLHGLDPSSIFSSNRPSRDDEGTGPNEVEFPDGTVVELDYLRDPPHEDARLLHALFVDAQYSVAEAAQYLEGELGTEIDVSELRQAAVDCGILDGVRSTEEDGGSSFTSTPDADSVKKIR